MSKCPKRSLFAGSADIRPMRLSRGVTAADLVDAMGETCFEARNVGAAARLLARIVSEGDTLWLGIAGAGIA